MLVIGLGLEPVAFLEVFAHHPGCEDAVQAEEAQGVSGMLTIAALCKRGLVDLRVRQQVL